MPFLMTCHSSVLVLLLVLVASGDACPWLVVCRVAAASQSLVAQLQEVQRVDVRVSPGMGARARRLQG